MTSAIDKTLKTCLYADVIEMIYYLCLMKLMNNL